MPTYRITDPKTGITLKITGDSPPNESELEELFAKYRPASAAMPEQPGMIQAGVAALQSPGAALKGAAKGAMGSVMGALEAADKMSPLAVLQGRAPVIGSIQRAVGAPVLPMSEAQQVGQGALEQARTEFAPSSPAESGGQMAEKIGEFFLPGAVGMKAARGAGLAANVAREALGAGAVSAAQTGGEPIPTAIGAALGGMAPAVGAAATRFGKPLSEKVIASLIRPLTKHLRFGADPAKAVAEEGIVANSLPGLGEAVAKRAAEYGQRVDQYLSQAGTANKRVNLEPALLMLDDAIVEARNAGERGLANQLKQLRNAPILQVADVTPAVATEIKRQLGKFTSWSDPTKHVLNTYKQKVYAELNRALERAVPGVKALNRRWGDLIEAAAAIEQRVGVAARHAPISLADAAFGGAGGITGGPIAGAAAIAGKRALSSTAVASRLAREFGRPRASLGAPLSRAYLGTSHTAPVGAPAAAGGTSAQPKGAPVDLEEQLRRAIEARGR